MSQPSLADQAVSTLAAVARMDSNVTNEHPERHQVRKLKQLAEQTLADAMRRAMELAWFAEDIQTENRKSKEPTP